MDRNNKPKKAWYKRVWVWIGIIVVIGIIASAAGGNKDTPASTNNSPTTTSEAPQETAPAKWDIEAAYAKLSTGMTKSQVEEATGKKSDNCTESDMGTLGKSESCSYGNAFIDKGSILVIYSNGELSSKTKSTY